MCPCTVRYVPSFKRFFPRFFATIKQVCLLQGGVKRCSTLSSFLTFFCLVFCMFSFSPCRPYQSRSDVLVQKNVCAMHFRLVLSPPTERISLFFFAKRGFFFKTCVTIGCNEVRMRRCENHAVFWVSASTETFALTIFYIIWCGWAKTTV